MGYGPTIASAFCVTPAGRRALSCLEYPANSQPNGGGNDDAYQCPQWTAHSQVHRVLVPIYQGSHYHNSRTASTSAHASQSKYWACRPRSSPPCHLHLSPREQQLPGKRKFAVCAAPDKSCVAYSPYTCMRRAESAVSYGTSVTSSPTCESPKK